MQRKKLIYPVPTHTSATLAPLVTERGCFRSEAVPVPQPCVKLKRTSWLLGSSLQLACFMPSELNLTGVFKAVSLSVP